MKVFIACVSLFISQLYCAKSSLAEIVIAQSKDSSRLEVLQDLCTGQKLTESWQSVREKGFDEK